MISICLILPITVAAMYALMVCVCIAGRMSRNTPHIQRVIITGLGFLAAWAVLRTVAGDWPASPVAALHAISVLLGAATLAYLPRISTHGHTARHQECKPWKH